MIFSGGVLTRVTEFNDEFSVGGLVADPAMLKLHRYVTKTALSPPAVQLPPDPPPNRFKSTLLIAIRLSVWSVLGRSCQGLTSRRTGTGSVRAHRTDGSIPDVNASFTAADRGQYQLVVPPGTYDLYASAVGYQTELFSLNFEVGSGYSYHIDGYLQPCGSAVHVGACTPVPEFGSETISAFLAVVVTMVVMTCHMKRLQIHRRKVLE